MKYPLKEEQLKYDVLYRDGYHVGPVPRTMNWGIPRMVLGEDRIIDLGCGHGTAREYFPRRESYLGVDLSRVQIQKNKIKQNDGRDKFNYANLAGHLDYSDKHFDLGISVDVLEHIPPQFIDMVVKDMCRVCKNLIISISLIPSHYKDHDGGPLHLCLRPREWWVELFKKYTNIEDTGSCGIGNLVMVCGPRACKRDVECTFTRDASKHRMLLDGTFMLPRRNEILEKEYDKRHQRIPGERRWEPRITWNYSIDAMPNANGPVYIVGKGPTLDNLTESSFADSPEAPIFCINESIFKVETLNLPNPIYLIQHDNINCAPQKETTTLILGLGTKNRYPHIAKRYIYSKHSMDLPINLTVLATIRIAQSIGATQINLVCFDAATHEDCGYADIIGYTEQTKADGDGPAGSRFLSHRKYIIDTCGETKSMWLTPDLGGAVAYTPQLLLGNHAGHREHDQEGFSSVSLTKKDLLS